MGGPRRIAHFRLLHSKEPQPVKQEAAALWHPKLDSNQRPSA